MPRAERDLAGLYRWIGARSSDAARKWYRGLREGIRSLRTSPQRCPATPENKDLRHLLYGRTPHAYRVIYRVAESRKEVEVLHIYSTPWLRSSSTPRGLPCSSALRACRHAAG